MLIPFTPYSLYKVDYTTTQRKSNCLCLLLLSGYILDRDGCFPMAGVGAGFLVADYKGGDQRGGDTKG